MAWQLCCHRWNNSELFYLLFREVTQKMQHNCPILESTYLGVGDEVGYAFSDGSFAYAWVPEQ